MAHEFSALNTLLMVRSLSCFSSNFYIGMSSHNLALMIIELSPILRLQRVLGKRNLFDVSFLFTRWWRPVDCPFLLFGRVFHNYYDPVAFAENGCHSVVVLWWSPVQSIVRLAGQTAPCAHGVSSCLQVYSSMAVSC